MASLQDRAIGAMKLSVATFEEVEADQTAIGQAALIVLASSLAQGVGWFYWYGTATGIVRGTLTAIVAWIVSSVLLWLIGTKVLPGKKTQADIGQVLRTVGFAQAPGIFFVAGILPGIGGLLFFAVSLWVLAAVFIAVRQALDYEDNFRAFIVVLIAWLAQVLLTALTRVGDRVVF